MDTTFPFGFPSSTAFYLVLFVLTLAVHVLFMNYVLAGTAWLAWSSIVRRTRFGSQSLQKTIEDASTNESILADWIPTMLSGAITAGVAPLLFVQILYQREFYTANLLLFNRWMSILPVLIIGFYSLYVLRSDWLAKRSVWLRSATGVAPFLCVAFVAYSWTENHLLSVRKPDQWREFYAAGKQVYFEPQILPRLAVWGLGSLATLCVWLGWQQRYRYVHQLPVDSNASQLLPKVALVGLVASLLSSIVYYATAPNLAAVFWGPLARWYFLFAMIGMAFQGTAWWRLLRKPLSGENVGTKQLLLGTTGLVFTVLGMSVCREAVRLSSLGESRLADLYLQHEQSMAVDGFVVFLFFAIINIGLIGWCFRLVKKNQ